MSNSELTWTIITWVLAIASLVGNILNVKKLRVCFILWIVCNIGWIIHDAYFGEWARIVLDSVQIAFSVWGFVKWK